MARLVGNPAPFFKADALVNGQNKQVSLDDYKGKWKVLFFYPLDFTFVCPTEIIAYSEAADKFKAMNCELIACSVDSFFSHLAWTKQPRNEGGLGEVRAWFVGVVSGCGRGFWRLVAGRHTRPHGAACSASGLLPLCRTQPTCQVSRSAS